MLKFIASFYLVLAYFNLVSIEIATSYILFGEQFILKKAPNCELK